MLRFRLSQLSCVFQFGGLQFAPNLFGYLRNIQHIHYTNTLFPEKHFARTQAIWSAHGADNHLARIHSVYMWYDNERERERENVCVTFSVGRRQRYASGSGGGNIVDNDNIIPEKWVKSMKEITNHIHKAGAGDGLRTMNVNLTFGDTITT